ncbi:hypothetical protein P7H22_24920 [Paenibacillus larvae]|nr:hypothetical protein [Paenibacillus larvae]MDT2242926.1 hypothetical protein [Paenibacillus larvae]
MGKKGAEKNLYQAIIKEGKGYTEVDDLRFQLILLTMLKQKLGMKPLPTYIENIKLANQEGFDANKYPLPDLMNRYYGETRVMILRLFCKNGNFIQIEYRQKLIVQKGASYTASQDIVSESQLSNARKLVDKRHFN